MELLKLLGILIVVIGFVLKLDSILIIMIAAIVTALVAGMDPVTFLETLGSSFVANRSMCVFVMVMVVTGTLERNGLKQAAANVMKKFKNASAGVVVAIYGVFRLIFAAFNVSFGGVAGFVRPIVLPMATAAAKKNGKKISEKYEENLKAKSFNKFALRMSTSILVGIFYILIYVKKGIFLKKQKKAPFDAYSASISLMRHSLP